MFRCQASRNQPRAHLRIFTNSNDVPNTPFADLRDQVSIVGLWCVHPRERWTSAHCSISVTGQSEKDTSRSSAFHVSNDVTLRPTVLPSTVALPKRHCKDFLGISHWFFLDDNEFYQSTLFVSHVINCLHGKWMQHWCDQSEIITTSYINAGNFKFVIPKISRSYVCHWPRKKREALLSGQPTCFSTLYYAILMASLQTSTNILNFTKSENHALKRQSFDRHE
jgi:hypothetical protein